MPLQDMLMQPYSYKKEIMLLARQKGNEIAVHVENAYDNFADVNSLIMELFHCFTR